MKLYVLAFMTIQYNLIAPKYQIVCMDKTQLDQLIAQSDWMSRSLQGLKQRVVAKKNGGVLKLTSADLLQSIRNRMILRNLTQTLQANRNLVQLKKESIERSRVFLEGLQSYKATLKSKISDYQIEVQNADEYFEEPIQQINWLNGYADCQEKVKESFQKIKQKNELLKQALTRRQKLKDTIDEQKKLHHQLIPLQIEKLRDEVKDVSRLLAGESTEQFLQISNKKLASVFDALNPLRRFCSIELTYCRQKYEFIELILKPCGFHLYNLAQHNSINIEQKEIKIQIVSLAPDFYNLCIGMDRRSDLTSFQVFNRLVSDETVKKIFEHPSNQSQRNLNTKYIKVDWVEYILCSFNVQGQKFIRTLRERIFCLYYIRHMFVEIKLNSHFTPLLKREDSQLMWEVANFSWNGINRISFNDFISAKYINLPPQIQQLLNQYQSYELQSHRMDERELQMFRRKKYELQNVLQKFNLQQFLIPHLNNYYNISFKYANVLMNAVIIIPYNYPRMQSVIKICRISLNKKQEPSQPTWMQTRKIIQDSEVNMDLSAIEKTEYELNCRIDELLSDKDCGQVLRIHYQLNRLMTLAILINNSHL